MTVLNKAHSALYKYVDYITQIILLVPLDYYQFTGVTAAHSSCLNSEKLVENEQHMHVF